MEEIKDELSILFPETEVEGYKIKAWSLGKLEKIAPYLERIINEVKRRGLKLEVLIKDPTDLFFSIVSDLTPIISITTGVHVDKIRELTIESALKISLVIAQQNVGYLKNVLIPMQAMLIAMKKTM
jgi:hypothetical protein